MGDGSNITEQLWSIADLLRESLRLEEYSDVILPFILLKRFSLVDFQELPIAECSSELLMQLSGANDEIKEILQGLNFAEHVTKLARGGTLGKVVQGFARIDLSPEDVAAPDIDDVIAQLLERFSRDTYSEHTTPTDVAQLLIALLFSDDQVANDVQVYDPACGTGGLLSAAYHVVTSQAHSAAPTLHGQDLNQKSAAICKARLYASGTSTSDILQANSLAANPNPNLAADYLVSQPPFGLDWRSSYQAVDAECKTLGDKGRFAAGLPRQSDGSLLFLLDMISKMKTPAEGGSRLVFVSSGSSLWSGPAASGESEIRKHIIEKDLLEAIVALPPFILPNTGIETFVWVLSNRKEPSRTGKVRLIDASESFSKIRRSGRKLYRIAPEQSGHLVQLLTEAAPDSQQVKILENREFGCRRLTVERPLKVRVDLTPESVAELQATQAWERLAKTPEGLDAQKAISNALAELIGNTYLDRTEWRKHLNAALGDFRVTKSHLKAIESSLGHSTDDAAVCMNGDEPEADPTLQTAEEMPLDQDIDAYLQETASTRPPDAWVSDTAVIYSIRRIAHLGFRLEREVKQVRSQYNNCQLLPMERVCKQIRRAKTPPREDSASRPAPALGITQFRELEIIANETHIHSDYLAMFFGTELGQKLIGALQQGSMSHRIDPEDLRALLVPVPALEDQLSVLAAKQNIGDLIKQLQEVEAELAANPENLQPVSDIVTPMLQSLGKLTDADEIRECIRSGESKRVEFKQTFSLDIATMQKEKRLEESSIKTIVAFLNSDGGDLLVGVHDEGHVTGLNQEIEKFHKSNPDKFLLHMKNRIKADIGEQCYPLLDQRLVAIDGVLVLWVRCSPSAAPVFYKQDIFFVRTNPATDQLLGQKMYEYIKTRFE